MFTSEWTVSAAITQEMNSFVFFLVFFLVHMLMYKVYMKDYSVLTAVLAMYLREIRDAW